MEESVASSSAVYNISNHSFKNKLCSIELNVNYSSVQWSRLISALLVIPPLLPNRAREHPKRNILSRRKGFQKTYIYIYDTPNTQHL